MIKGVIFDVDGTLLDSMPIWENAGEEYLRMNGIEPEPGTRDVLFRMSLEEGAQYLIGQYKLHKSVREVVGEICGQIQEFYEEKVMMKPGAETLIKILDQKGIPMIAATSGDRSCIEKAFERLGVSSTIKQILTCTEIGAGKNSPDIYLKAAAILRMEPREIWVFEDVLHALCTAKNAGFHTVAVRDEAEVEQEKLKNTADVYLYTYENIQKFMEVAFENQSSEQN